MSVPEELRQALAEGRLVPFVGSGVSCGVDCRFPSWASLLQLLGADLRCQGSENEATLVETLVQMNRYGDAAEEALRAFSSEHAFQAKIVQRFDKHIDGNLSVPLAVWALQPKLILTTNYDLVLEAANPGPGSLSITNKYDFALRDLEAMHKPVAWHLHGSVQDPGTIILAPSQYARLYHRKDAESSLAMASLRELLSRRTLLFVGFGFNDFEVLGAMKEVLNLFEGAFPVSFAVLRNDDRLPREAERLWKDYKVRVIRVDDYKGALVELLTNLRCESTTEVEEKSILKALAQFNRRVALELGARHASTHLHFQDEAKGALVAPGRTSCGCITWEPLVAPIKETGRFTVRLFSELLPGLTAGCRAATYGWDSIYGVGTTKDRTNTVYGETFRSLLAGLVEVEGKPIGVVKVENKLPEIDGTFDENATQTLVRLIQEFTPHLQQAHRWIQKRDWSEAQFLSRGLV